MDLQQHMNNLLAAALATQEARRASYDSKPTMQHDPITMAPMVKQEDSHQAADEKYDVTHYNNDIRDSIMLPVCSGSDGQTTMRAVTRKELSDAIDGLLSHELAATSSKISSDRPHSTGATPEPEPKQTHERVSTGMTTFAPTRPAAWRDERGPGHIIRHREDNTAAARGHAPGLTRDEAPGDFYASQRQQHAASKLQQLGGSALRKPVQRALPQSFVPPSSVRVTLVVPPQQKRPPIVDTEICGVCAQNHGSNDAFIDNSQQTCDFTHHKAQGYSHCSNCEHKKKNGKPKLQCNRAGKVANRPTVNKQQSGALGASSTSHKADVVPLHKSDRRDSGYGGLPVANVLSERRTYDSPYPQMPAQYGPDLASQIMGSMFGIQMPMPPTLDGASGMQAPMHGMPGNPYGMFDGSYGMPSVPSGMPELSQGPTNSYRQPTVHTEPLPYAAWLAGYGMQSASQADVQTHDPLRGPMHPDRQKVYEISAAARPIGPADASTRTPLSNSAANATGTDLEELEKLKHKQKSLAGMTQSMVQKTPWLLDAHMKAIASVDRSVSKLHKRSKTFGLTKPDPALQKTILDARIRALDGTHRQLRQQLERAEASSSDRLPMIRQNLELNERKLFKLKPIGESPAVPAKESFQGPRDQDGRIVRLAQKLHSLRAEHDRAAKLNPERVPSLTQKIAAVELEITALAPGTKGNSRVNASVADRVVVDLTGETTHGRAACDQEPRATHSIRTAEQRTLGSDEVLGLIEDLRGVSAKFHQAPIDEPHQSKIAIGNKGIRKLEEKRRMLNAALIKAREEDPECVSSIEQEIKANEVVYRKAWHEMRPRVESKLHSLRAGLEKIRSEQPGRYETQLGMIRTAESALEELKSDPAYEDNQADVTDPRDSEQVRSKRKHDDDHAKNVGNDLSVLDGNFDGPAQKKARVRALVPDHTVDEDFIAFFACDSIEKGAPSKTKVMVTNLPYGLSKVQKRACLALDGQERMGREIGVKVAVARALVADRKAAIEGETNGQMLNEINLCQKRTAAARTEETKTLYIGNLPYATTELDLGNLFAGFGVERVSLQADALTSKVHGFVDVATSANAERAIVELNRNVVLGHKVSVQLFGLRAGTWS
ncbi:hypothetical protein LTR10_001695 [Elasticomyces elasticus]|nr:hypothetical protein LTR10_001695 [Elasticomyces elasticus]KAK4975195.1 hypothetical protein LTR42_004405 [Elasticomyces elasticus]